jgi:hypothetical protein
VVNTQAHIESFLLLLEQQTGLINTLARQELELQQYIADREWSEVDRTIVRMSVTSEAITRAEEERNAAFLDLSPEPGGSVEFSAVIARLPVEVRGEISRRYRELKVAVLRLQSYTANMDSYLRAALATSRGVLRELFPEHSPRGYSSDGQGRLGEGTALMVNQHR